MPTVTKEPVFRRHQKVVAAVDLPHVPAGTPGRVLYVAGVTWPRYHVRFDNGEVVSSLDATQLADRRDWERQQYERRRAARSGAGVAA
jgi:hypothetical protein